MKKIIISILIFCFTPGIAQQPDSKMNPEWLVSSSSIKFKIKNAGFNVDGSFSGLTAKIFFDETNAGTVLL